MEYGLLNGVWQLLDNRGLPEGDTRDWYSCAQQPEQGEPKCFE